MGNPKKDQKFLKEKQMASRRRHIRFEPDMTTVAYLDLAKDEDEFKAQLSALVINQSYKGVALAVRRLDELRIGIVCYVKVGELAPLRGEIIWTTSDDPEVMKIGIKFLD